MLSPRYRLLESGASALFRGGALLLVAELCLGFLGVGGSAAAEPPAPQAASAEPSARKPAAGAEPASARRRASKPRVADRAVVRFSAPETGGISTPQFIYERELAFEARLEALADRAFRATRSLPYRDRHIRAAIERHISETLLAALRIDRPPSEQELRLRADQSRRAWLQRVGGERALAEAALLEGLTEAELLRIFRRQARASLYIDRMITPMLRPSRLELEGLHRSAETPFRGRPFAEVQAQLENWYVSRRLASALQSYFQNARSRIRIQLLS